LAEQVLIEERNCSEQKRQSSLIKIERLLAFGAYENKRDWVLPKALEFLLFEDYDFFSFDFADESN
jgi:hypothetical protein